LKIIYNNIVHVVGVVLYVFLVWNLHNNLFYLLFACCWFSVTLKYIALTLH